MKHLSRQEVALAEQDEKLEGQPDQIGLQDIDRQANEDWSKRKLRREEEIDEDASQCHGTEQNDRQAFFATGQQAHQYEYAKDRIDQPEPQQPGT